jgi:phytoene synthase
MRPHVYQPERASPADLAQCREMIRTGSRSFFAASLLLPDPMRSGAYALYAFCRCSDDCVDVDGGGSGAIAGLARRLDAVYRGAPENNPVDRALTDAVERFVIPRTPFDALLEGLAWDAEGRRYQSFSDVCAYAARVAGAVGAMMAALMGARVPELVARACDLGIAMQLTNIARDVGDDARLGRLYLPISWMREAGLDPQAWLEAPRYSPQLGAVVARLLAEADTLYARADLGIAALPRAYRPAIRAARLLYADIGAEVKRRGFDSISARAVVSSARKLALVARAYAAPARVRPAAAQVQALKEAQYLVDAVASKDNPGDSPNVRVVEGDIGWALELFAALAERPRRLA